MTWTNLLANKEAQKHKTSKKELDNMRSLVRERLSRLPLARAFRSPTPCWCEGFGCGGGKNYERPFQMPPMALWERPRATLWRAPTQSA